MCDEYGYTPLHYASRAGHEKIVKMLVEAGCEVCPQGLFSRS